MTTDPFTTAARALGADPAEVRESMRNATEHAERNGMPDEDFVLWVWHAGAVWARGMEAARAAQEPTDAELDALYDAFMAHNEDERCEEYTRTEDGEPYHERICSECGEAVWIKGEHYWAATRANGTRKRHHAARAALSAARAARRDEEKR